MSLTARLYHGESSFDFVGRRKIWYGVTAVVLLLSVVAILVRGFNWSIEFSGGGQFIAPASASATVEQARAAVEAVDGVEVMSAQVAADTGFVIRTGEVTQAQSTLVKDSLAKTLKVEKSAISDSSVSASWGSQVTRRALLGLVIFLIVVCMYISVRFEPRMAAAAIAALLHDLLLTVALYAIVGFEVSPPTVIGLLTVLGFSLYDTVVVFDKVAENSKGLLSSTRMTYAEAANLAINQTIMRSINTSLTALLPVAGLLFVGAGLLGVGTLKDLALVLFVGLAAGTYSSIFLATPLLVDLKLRDPKYRQQAARVAARRLEVSRSLAAVAVASAGPGAQVISSPTSLTPRPGVRPPPKNR